MLFPGKREVKHTIFGMVPTLKNLIPFLYVTVHYFLIDFDISLVL